MRLAILATLCLVAYAKIQQRQSQSQESQESLYQQLRGGDRQIRENSFKSGREYQFLYNGQVMTGMPGSSKQHAGSRIKAVVLLQIKEGQQAVLRLADVRFGKLNEKVQDPRKTQPFSLFEQVPISSELKQLLEKPVAFKYTDGLVSDMQWEESEQPWAANIKRGILNLLQINLKQHNRIQSEEKQVSNQLRTSSIESEIPQGSSRYFRALEKTLEGECETIYEIGRRPNQQSQSSEPVLNVTKSIDFETCQKRPQIKYNWRFTEECPTCEPRYQQDEKFLKSSTVIRYNVTGNRDQFLIQGAEADSQYVFVPHEEDHSVVTTYIRQKLELAQTNHISTELRVSGPIKSQTNLIFSLEWDIQKEKFFMAGENKFHQKTPYSAVHNKPSLIADLLRHLVNSMDEQVQEETPHYFSRLVTVLRMLTRSELQQIHATFVEGQHASFTQEEQKKAKDFLISAMALAGTHDATAHLVQKIRERKISSLTAAFIIRQLQSARVVSEQMIQQLLSLARDQVAQEHHQLKQAIWLTIGSLSNAICSENDDQLAIEQKARSSEQVCSMAFKNELVKAFFNELKQSNKWEDQLIILKAIKNAGIDSCIPELEKIIKNAREQQYSPLLRVQAILALDNLRVQMPRTIRKVLVPVFMNPQEQPEVRMAAIHMVMNTQPERPILEMIAKTLDNEPSRQVAAFAYTYMSSLANSTNPCYQNMTSDLKLALRFTKKVRTGLQFSKFANLPFHAPKLGMGFDLNLFHLMSNKSLIPVRTSVTLDTNYLGMWNRFWATIGLSAEGLEPVLHQLMGEKGLFSEGSYEDGIWKKSRRSEQMPYEQELKQLFQTLKITSRKSSQEPKAFVDLRLKGQEIGFLALSKDSLAQLLQEGSISLKQAEQNLRQGVHLNINKATMLREMSFRIPTIVGLPLVWSVKVPAVMALKGKVQLEGSYQEGKMALKGDLKASFAVSAIQSTEIWCPIANSGLKIRIEARGFAPLRGQIQAQTKGTNREVKLIVEPPKTQKDILTVETKPTTFTFVWPKTLTTWQEAEQKTIKGEEWNRVQTTETAFGQKVLGVELNIRSRWHKTPFWRLSGTPMIPFSGPNKLVVQIRPGVSQPQEIEIRLDAALARPSTQQYQSELKMKTFDMFPGDSSSSESVSASSSQSREQKKGFKYSAQQLRARQARSHSRMSSKSTSDSSEESFESQPKGETRVNQLTMEVIARGPVKRRASLVCNHQYSRDLRFHRVSAQAQFDGVSQLNLPKQEIAFDAEVVFPTMPETLKQVEQKKVVGQARLRWNQDRFVALKVQAERSAAQKRYEQEMRQQKDECWYYTTQLKVNAPVACYDKIAQMAMLKKYTVDVDFSQNLPVAFKNVTSKLLRFLKYQYYWQTQVSAINVQNQQNKIQAKIYLDPETNQRVNVSINLPHENIIMTSIPLPVKVAALNTRRSMLSQYLSDATSGKYQSRAVCQVSDRRVRTFDGSRFSIPQISTCYSLLAKDCVEDSRFAVMIKKISESSQQKKLKVLTPRHKIVLSLENGGPVKVQINDQDRQVEDIETIQEHGHEVAIIKRLAAGTIQVELPETGIEVHFDGYTANIHASPLYMSRQCGICGHYDSEPGYNNEFITPSHQTAKSLKSFYRDYTMVDGQCSLPTKFEKHSWNMRSKESSQSSSSESRSTSKSSSSSSESSSKAASKSKSSSESNSKTESQSNSKSTSASKSKSSSSESAEFSRKQRNVRNPLLRTLKIERLGKVCMSVEKAPTCPKGHYVVQYAKQQKQVEFICFHRENYSELHSSFESSEESKSAEARVAKLKSQSQVHSRIQQSVQVPRKCQQF
jgi:hypothetical protein